MNAVAAIAAKEIREGLRNRWIVATTALLGALALTLSFLGSAPTGTVGASPLDVMVVSLSSLTIFLIPLIALLLSHDAIVGEAERGTLLLLLSYPVRRGEVVLGKFLGHIAVLAVATVVGYGAAGLALALVSGEAMAGGLAAFAAMLAASILLGAAFLAIGYLVSAFARERGIAAGIAIGIWLVLRPDLRHDAARRPRHRSGADRHAPGPERAAPPQPDRRLPAAEPDGLERCRDFRRHGGARREREPRPAGARRGARRLDRAAARARERALRPEGSVTGRALLAVLCLGLVAACDDADEPPPPPAELTRDAVGHYDRMVVLDHAGPKAQIHLESQDEPIWFSSVRDAFAFAMLPEEPRDIVAIYVSDMGRAASWDDPGPGTWIEARQARFVIGSRKRGGMGAEEPVPFGEAAAAEAFAAEHGGEVVAFDGVPEDYVLGATVQPEAGPPGRRAFRAGPLRSGAMAKGSGAGASSASPPRRGRCRSRSPPASCRSPSGTGRRSGRGRASASITPIAPPPSG